MHDRCPACGLKFEREPGYYLGAMYVSYGLALVTIVVIAIALWLTTNWSLPATWHWESVQRMVRRGLVMKR